ncbi:helix-turn-helix domain-containing protein [Aerococcus sp. NPDC058936]|uniref:helix-turn-helix domain-containing protein n=1 Tax=Aerococcus sp. NPDC058936 TaxID=3346674 RepID=UPI00366F7049
MKLNLKRLRAERIAQGLSQEEMAHLMGWKSRGAYAKRENGFVNIGADELAHMAEILGYEADDLGIFFTVNVPKREQLI